jgi:hypothetical protein
MSDPFRPGAASLERFSLRPRELSFPPLAIISALLFRCEQPRLHRLIVHGLGRDSLRDYTPFIPLLILEQAKGPGEEHHTKQEFPTTTNTSPFQTAAQ